MSIFLPPSRASSGTTRGRGGGGGAERERKRQRDRQRQRHKDRQTDRDRRTETHKHRHRHRETERQRKAETERDRYTERETDRKRRTERHTETQIEKKKSLFTKVIGKHVYLNPAVVKTKDYSRQADRQRQRDNHGTHYTKPLIRGLLPAYIIIILVPIPVTGISVCLRLRKVGAITRFRPAC